MENGIITTLDGEAVDITEYIVDIQARPTTTREDYFLRKFGSLHNAYLAWQKVSIAEGRASKDDDMELFLHLLQHDLDWYENSK